MNVLIATPEAIPYAKTGGLADVAGTLLGEFQRLKLSARLVMPYYRRVKEGFSAEPLNKPFRVKIGEKVYSGGLYGSGPAVFIECDELFDREELYGTPEGDYPDNAQRFIFFSRAVLEAAKALDFKPDVIHVHDWQAGLVPFYLKTLYEGDPFFVDTKSVITIHNLGYQGIFPKEVLALAGLGPEFFTPETLEFYGNVNFLKAGLLGADRITTVSPTYAKEIMTPEYGFGLDGLLRKRAGAVSGILNGIDVNYWNPQKDTAIPANFGVRDLRGKLECRKALVKKCGFGNSRAPMASFIGRLSAQKGLDLLAGAAEAMIAWGMNLVILGKGDESYQDAMLELGEAYKGKVHVTIGFEDEFSHLIYAGSDMFLMPSIYEPCGLGQMIAMRYGTPPIARKTGGLSDTVLDYSPVKGGSGFLFESADADGLRQCARAALLACSEPRRWEQLVKTGMRLDLSWKASARKYVELYEEAAGRS